MNTNQQKSSDRNIQALLQQASDLVIEDQSIDEVKKEKISSLLSEVDFLLGKYDHYYEKFSEVFEAASTFDFTKRLIDCEHDIEFIRFLSLGINTILEELKDHAIHKALVHTMLETIDLSDAIIITTDSNGQITFVHNEGSMLANFNESTLTKQSIHILFKDFSPIDKNIRDRNGKSFKNLPVTIQWKGEEIPSELSVSVFSRFGKIGGLIYLIKLPSTR